MNLLMGIDTINIYKLLNNNLDVMNMISNFDLLTQIIPPISLNYKTKQFTTTDDRASSNHVLEIKNGNIKFEIPPFKSDIFNDCDVADDIARAYGYNNIKSKFPNISSIGNTLEFSDFRNQISQTLISLGFLELYTYMLTSTKYQFEMMDLKEENFDFIKLNDSAEEGINMIRPLILPENLRSLLINRKNKYPQKVFENGFTIQKNSKAETGAKDIVKLSCSIADPKSNYTQIKFILDSVLKLNEIEFKIQETKKNFLIEGRSAEILLKGKEVGFIGELHPKVLTNFGLIVPVSSFEINLTKIFELINNN